MTEAWFGLIGVILGSVITISKDSWALWRERRRDGSYSAIRLICILEEYANKCIDVAGDDGTAYGRPAGRWENGEEVHEAQVATPHPPDYPSDVSWRSLDESLMHRILALPNKARSTDRYIAGRAEHAHPPDYSEVFEPRQEGYARLGLDTLDIVAELRRRYGVVIESRTDLGNDWDPKAHLEGHIERFEKRDAERQERRNARQAKAAAAKEAIE